MAKSVNSFTPEQKQAITHLGGPLLVVAGAGTGKTRVITERIKWLMREKKAKPEEILALTFTDKAAEEMLERIDIAMPLSYEEPWLLTFHSFADRILKDEALEIGLDPSYKILTPPQAWILVRQHLFDFSLKHYRPLGNPTKFISAMLGLFSRAQDEDVSPNEFLNWAQKFFEEANVKNPTGDAAEAAIKEEAQKYLELAEAYKTYADLKIKTSCLDFGDLINYSLKLFRERPSILKKYQDQFRYILVDEFQDTNYSQYQLIKLLAPSKRNPELVVTGDDDQAVYRFRGASVSNIIEFKKDYPQAGIVVLKNNFRSTQPILDSAYNLIQHNNPDRLEVKLGLEKKLTAFEKRTGIHPHLLHAKTGEEEVEFVVQSILKLKKNHEWRDFAILARANNHLEPFMAALRRLELPYQMISNRGLYEQDEVKDVIAALHVLVDPNDSISFFRFLNFSIFKIEPELINRYLNIAHKSRQSLWEVAISETTNPTIKNTVEIINKFQQYLPKKSVAILIHEFLNEIGYIKQLLESETIESSLKIKNLNLFLEKVKQFEREASEPNVSEFLNYLELLIESGESPAQAQIEDVDTVNLLTVHSAKGLEFPVVFMVNLVSDRFPTRDRREPLPLPDALIKETLPEGDAHLEEERRLFYVGITRAQKELFLSYADSYGGSRLKKPSPFISELNLNEKENYFWGGDGIQLGIFRPRNSQPKSETSLQKNNIQTLSYSQLESFDKCPLQYKFRYILGIPEPPQHALAFGQTIHRALRDFHREAMFNNADVPLNRLFELYDRHFLREGYKSREHQTHQLESGRTLLERYYNEGRHQLGTPIALEKKFTIKIGDTNLAGFVDRIDKNNLGEIEIVDYKTGEKKDQKEVDKNKQLAIYALGAIEALKLDPKKLTMFYIEHNQKVTTEKPLESLEQKKEEILERIGEIKSSNFPAKAGLHCTWCSYKTICSNYRASLV